ncbi:MAG TPA: hypothetical protein VLU99_02210 [Nitrososphaerales archaeon]|nr:hypothetical protein [Nitrososphaerales archaeon]HUK74578.1 hypothetical protein [Nitrososphaerales archaeon]
MNRSKTSGPKPIWVHLDFIRPRQTHIPAITTQVTGARNRQVAWTSARSVRPDAPATACAADVAEVVADPDTVTVDPPPNAAVVVVTVAPPPAVAVEATVPVDDTVAAVMVVVTTPVTVEVAVVTTVVVDPATVEVRVRLDWLVAVLTTDVAVAVTSLDVAEVETAAVEVAAVETAADDSDELELVIEETDMVEVCAEGDAYSAEPRTPHPAMAEVAQASRSAQAKATLNLWNPFNASANREKFASHHK